MKFLGTSIIQNGGVTSISDQKAMGVEKEVYEVFRVENKKPLFLDDHLQRFSNSLRNAGKELPVSMDKIKSLLDWMMICNPISDANIRLSLLPDGLFQGGFIRSKYPTPQMYAHGVKCLTMNKERTNPSAKVFQAEMRTQVATIQKSEDAYETILINREGLVTEGSRSNIFFIKDNVLITAPSHLILEGIIRKKVIEAADLMQVEIIFEAINVQKISSMEAAFITGTSPRLLPIGRIDNHAFDVNHPMMRQLMDRLGNLISNS